MSPKLFKSAATVGFPLNKYDKSTDKCKLIAFYSFNPFFFFKFINFVFHPLSFKVDDTF